VGDRENIGIFGGPASDLTYSGQNERVFATVNTPFTLFYSDDTCKTWVPAFSADSMEYAFATRGWGGGSDRVITNQVGWVAVKTGLNLPNRSAVPVSYNNGNQFETAFDPIMLELLTGVFREVTAIEINDHHCFIAMEQFIVRTNDTTSFGPGQLILNIDTIPGITPGSRISWLAASNSTTGYPMYFVVTDNTLKGRLFKSYGNIFLELSGLPANHQFVNVFTHPVQENGDTLFCSTIDTLSQELGLFRSYSGGFGFTDITPTSPIPKPLSDVDYSEVWQVNLPQGDGLRLSFPGGLLSDDQGQNWQGPGLGLFELGIATHPSSLDLILGSDNVGVKISNNGILGSFVSETNIRFASVQVHDFSQSFEHYYIATEAGLAFTKEYYNPFINGYDQWVAPNGVFPVPGVGDEEGVSSVAVNPANNQHIVCGYKGGFYVSFSGVSDFFQVTPANWNNTLHGDPYVTDIIFVNSNLVIALTGQKFKPLPAGPPPTIGNIWRSSDGGLSWNLATPYFPDEFVMGNCLSIGTSGPQTVIYAGTGYMDEFSAPVNGALWASTDQGDTWSKVNDAPVFNSLSPLPIYDIDVDPQDNDIIYLSAANVLARSSDGGNSYFFTDVPYNQGIFTSALIDPVYPDSVTVSAGRNIFKYSYTLDDADLKFKGLPGEVFSASSVGSVLGGSGTGASKILEAPTHFLDLKVYIEGAFNGTDLNPDLNTLGYLPLQQPFSQEPWFYNGTESVASIPNADVVDWILIELRKTTGNSASATAETRFDRKAAFLLKDGSIVDDDGITSPRFNIIFGGTKDSEKAYGVVYAPSHVGSRSADSLNQAKGSTYSYDFTTGADQVFGGSYAHKEIAAGVWGMIAGDGNHDNRVDNADKNDVWLIQNGNSGYYFGDFNRDGTVDIDDITDFWKPNAGSGIGID